MLNIFVLNILFCTKIDEKPNFLIEIRMKSKYGMHLVGFEMSNITYYVNFNFESFIKTINALIHVRGYLKLVNNYITSLLEMACQ